MTFREPFGRILSCDEQSQSAAVAQVVERRLGKAEVGGSNPLGSFSFKESLETRVPFLRFWKDFQTNFRVIESRKKKVKITIKQN